MNKILKNILKANSKNFDNKLVSKINYLIDYYLKFERFPERVLNEDVEKTSYNEKSTKILK